MWCELLRTISRSNIVHLKTVLPRRNQYLIYLANTRLYSKDKCSTEKEKKVKELQKKICLSQRTRPLQVCKPKTEKPCVPITPSQPKKTEGKELGKPDCPWEDVEKDQSKKYKRIALLALILAAAALGYLYYKTPDELEEEEKKRPNKIFTRPRPACKDPKDGTYFPKHVPYLLIGGGTASFAAFRAIKSADPKAKVLVISNECQYPYMRPPLSKEMWFTESERKVNNLIFKQWNGADRSLFYEPNDFYTPVKELDSNENGGVSVALGWNIRRIDVVNRIVYLDDNTPIEYNKCLIATGAKPKNICVFADAKQHVKDKVTLFRDVFDFQELNEIFKTSSSIAIIGGGFLGSELACALARKGKQNNINVYQIFKEEGNMSKILPQYLCAWTTKKVKDEGVTIIPKTNVEDAELKPDKDGINKVVLHLSNGKKIYVDHVIVSVGVEPNTDLAKTSDLEVDPDLGGFLVNTEMEARSNLYVAGDCSCFYDTKLGRRRVEHHDHAVVSGRLAGENMAGAAKPYLHQSMFWSDLGPDVGYEAIGVVDSSLPTVGVFAKACAKDSPKGVVSTTNDNIRSNTEDQSCSVDTTQSPVGETETRNEDFGKGVIFYLRDNTVVGIILWNVFNRMSVARQVLKDQRKYDDLNEVAKLFNIHDAGVEESEASN